MPEESYENIREGTYAANLLIVLMGVALILIISLYQSSLLTVLLYPPTPPVFENLDQLLHLVQTKQLTIVTDYVGAWFDSQVQQSAWNGSDQNSYFARLRRAFEINPLQYRRENMSDNVDEMMRLIRTGRYAYFRCGN